MDFSPGSTTNSLILVSILLLEPLFITNKIKRSRQFNFPPLSVFKLTSALATCRSFDPCCTGQKCSYKKTSKIREQNYFLKFNVPSDSLHLWHKETGPLTNIHDLKDPQDLVSQCLYDFIFCSPSLTPLQSRWPPCRSSVILYRLLPQRSLYIFCSPYPEYLPVPQLPSLLSHLFQVFTRKSLSQ